MLSTKLSTFSKPTCFSKAMKSRYLYIKLDLLCLSITKVHVTVYTFPTSHILHGDVVQTELNTSEIRCI